jgi:putative hydrolase of HD superfamily
MAYEKMQVTSFERLPLSDVLRQRLAFIREIEALKHVVRQTLVLDASRLENDAEHTWEIAVMAMVLSDYAPAGTDQKKVLDMLLVHDLVEIDAGDAYAYDALANSGQEQRERLAADRIFGLLPDPQSENLKALWIEFEEQRSKEAMFAKALDRLQPLLHNHQTEGKMWKVHGVTARMVMNRVAPIARACEELGALAHLIIEDAERLGFFGQRDD